MFAGSQRLRRSRPRRRSPARVPEPKAYPIFGDVGSRHRHLQYEHAHPPGQIQNDRDRRPLLASLAFEGHPLIMGFRVFRMASAVECGGYIWNVHTPLLFA